MDLADPITTKINYKPGSDVKPFFDTTTINYLLVVISLICLIAVVYRFTKVFVCIQYYLT